MAYSKRTTTFHSIFFSRGMALAIVFLAIFVGFGVVSIAEKSIDASRERKLAEAQVASLTQKDAAMSKKLTELDTDDGKEAALREQFPLVMPGEHIVMITDPSASDSPDPSLPPDPSQKPGFWNFLKNIF